MKLFGTDGIRGTAGIAPLDEVTVARVGAALVRVRGTAGRPMRVLVGRDTRESGVWIERALAQGLVSNGAEMVSAGVVPTPAVAYLTPLLRFDAGEIVRVGPRAESAAEILHQIPVDRVARYRG